MKRKAEPDKASSALECHAAMCLRATSSSAYKSMWEYNPVPSLNAVDYSPAKRIGGMPPASVEDKPVVSSAASAALEFRLKKSIDSRTWKKKQSDHLVAAIRKWASILLICPLAFDLGRKLAAQQSSTREAVYAGLSHIFSGRSSGTLGNRAGPILRYVAWCHSVGVVPFPMMEQHCYDFARGSKHTAPTFLRSFLVSIAFCHFVLGLTGADMCRESLRVQGVARESYLTKRKRCQRDPLTVQQVRILELLVCGELDARPAEQLGAWFFLVCMYSRARYSDGLNMCDIFIDCPDPKRKPLYGFFQGRVSRSKTAYTTERKTMNLPMVGPRRGVSGRDWVGAGLALRKRLPISMAEGNPLLPAPTRAGWQQVPLGAGQAGLWLRGILKMLRESPEAVSNVGTHSCKTTVLSWLAKAGVSLETRRILGMHTTPGEQTLLVYSRDALSGPLREMQSVIDEVASGAFRPDEVRVSC